MCCVVLCCVVHVLCCTCDVLCCVFFFLPHYLYCGSSPGFLSSVRLFIRVNMVL